MEYYLPLVALLFDSIIGDPRTRFHPVVIIGNLINGLEKQLLKTDHHPNRKKANGILLVILVLGITYGAAWLLDKFLYTVHPVMGFIGGALALSFVISPRSLAEAGSEIKNYLDAGDLSNARHKVNWIVGRDTANMDTAEVTRATVETVAENIVDGIISPLFYYALGGLPLAFLYRAVNTMDSMVGYKNEKYLDFGMPAARVDDVFNFIPARMTGILILLSALILRLDFKGSLTSIVQDASKHPSPNSGITEAGIAGALGIRLGGLNYYGGIPSFRSYMGRVREQLAPHHIAKTVQMMYSVTILFIIMLALLAIRK